MAENEMTARRGMLQCVRLSEGSGVTGRPIGRVDMTAAIRFVPASTQRLETRHVRYFP
jgi:hypothetical protein